MPRLLLLLTGLLVACGGGSVRAPVTIPAKTDAAADAVRRALEPLYQKGVLQGGMVIALVEPNRDGGVGYLRFGRTSPAIAEAPGTDAIFEIGSVSKVFTSLLLAESAARGEVTLDTEVGRLLPFGVRFPDKDGARATLEHLASHRAGLESLPANLSPKTLENPYAEYGVHQLHAYLEQAQLIAAPGERYAYSNLGAGLLGHLLATRLGVSYEQAVKTRILSPLELAETWITVPAPMQKRVVPGTNAGGKPAPAWTFDVLAGAGAWRSTPRDMVRLIQLAAKASAGQEVPLGDVLRRTFSPVGEVGGGGMQIGLAWHINESGVVWHNGMTGGYASFIGFDPATSKGVVVLASTASPLVTRIGMGVFDVFAGKPLELGLEIVDLTDAQLDALVGSYRLADGSELQVQRQGDALFLAMGPEQVRLYPRSPTTFLVMEIEAQLEFIVEDGAVRGFALRTAQGDILAERVEVKP